MKQTMKKRTEDGVLVTNVNTTGRERKLTGDATVRQKGIKRRSGEEDERWAGEQTAEWSRLAEMLTLLYKMAH